MRLKEGNMILITEMTETQTGDVLRAMEFVVEKVCANDEYRIRLVSELQDPDECCVGYLGYHDTLFFKGGKWFSMNSESVQSEVYDDDLSDWLTECTVKVIEKEAV